MLSFCLYDPHTALSLLFINDRFRPYLIGLADTFYGSWTELREMKWLLLYSLGSYQQQLNQKGVNIKEKGKKDNT